MTIYEIFLEKSEESFEPPEALEAYLNPQDAFDAAEFYNKILKQSQKTIYNAPAGFKVVPKEVKESFKRENFEFAFCFTKDKENGPFCYAELVINPPWSEICKSKKKRTFETWGKGSYSNGGLNVYAKVQSLEEAFKLAKKIIKDNNFNVEEFVLLK